MVANQVNDRMGRAVGELKEKYQSGGEGYRAASDAQVMNNATSLSKQSWCAYFNIADRKTSDFLTSLTRG